MNQYPFREEVGIIKILAVSNNLRFDVDEMIHQRMIRRSLDRTTSLSRSPVRKTLDKWIPSLIWDSLPQFEAVAYPFGFQNFAGVVKFV